MQVFGSFKMGQACRLIRQWKSVAFIVFCVVFILIILLAFSPPHTEDISLSAEELKTLKFLQVIFRHGDRTVLGFYEIANDPYRNYTYPPYGVGELTNEGRNQMYVVGEKLRKRYNQFLDDYYMPNLIRSTTSHVPRSQQSLQLVLAGLFPPKNEQIWESDINWQPIPYKIRQDQLLLGLYCPSFKKLYWEFIKRPEILKIYQNETIFDYVSLHTGQNITRPAQLFTIEDYFNVRHKFGLILPKWVEKIFPDELHKWANLSLEFYVGTDQMKRIFIGYLLKHLLKEIHDKIDGSLDAKLSLYSGHDINLFGIGEILDLLDEPTIPFGLSILIELHEINKNYTLKFYYVDFNRPGPEIEQQLNMAKTITVDEYSSSIEKYLPEDNECGGSPEIIYDF